MKVILKEQEVVGEYKFDGNLFMTKGFIEVFGDNALGIAFKTMDLIKERIKQVGADYFQVAEFNDVTYWVIDDVDHITFLLPDEY